METKTTKKPDTSRKKKVVAKKKVSGTATAKANGVPKKKVAVAKKADDAKKAGVSSKYIFPEGTVTQADQKTFREGVRKKFRKYTADIAKAENDKEKKKLEREFEAWKKTVYSNPAEAGIKSYEG